MTKEDEILELATESMDMDDKIQLLFVLMAEYVSLRREERKSEEEIIEESKLLIDRFFEKVNKDKNRVLREPDTELREYRKMELPRGPPRRRSLENKFRETPLDDVPNLSRVLPRRSSNLVDRLRERSPDVSRIRSLEDKLPRFRSVSPDSDIGELSRSYQRSRSYQGSDDLPRRSSPRAKEFLRDLSSPGPFSPKPRMSRLQTDVSPVDRISRSPSRAASPLGRRTSPTLPARMSQRSSLSPRDSRRSLPADFYLRS